MVGGGGDAIEGINYFRFFYDLLRYGGFSIRLTVFPGVGGGVGWGGMGDN